MAVIIWTALSIAIAAGVVEFVIKPRAQRRGEKLNTQETIGQIGFFIMMAPMMLTVWAMVIGGAIFVVFLVLSAAGVL